MSDVQKKANKNTNKTFLTAAVVIIAVVLFVLVFHIKKGKDEEKEIEKGIQYLTELESRDVSEIYQNVKAARPTVDWDAAVEDEAALWTEFEDAIILGDSRVTGFSYYGYLPKEQVLAKSGRTIESAATVLEGAGEIDPEEIYLCYGMSDMVQWPEIDEFASVYETELEKLHDSYPGCDIYVNSILPFYGNGLESNEVYSRCNEFNDALEKLCAENGWKFIDNSQVAKEHKDLYEPDGIHVSNNFLKYWAANMQAGVQK